MPSEWRHSPLRTLLQVLYLSAAFALAGTGCAPAGVYHVVEPGQTLYRIAKTYAVDETQLAKVNGITDPKRLEVGQRLYIPGATQTQRVPPRALPKSASPSAASVPSPPPAKRAPKAPVPKAKPAAEDPTLLGKAEVIPGLPPAPGTFAWPVRGQVVSAFGSGDGKAGKGIEIAVPLGTPVTAAAAGKVIYSGTIRGFGNLVILEHADNYFTVYGFNSKNLVPIDSFVGQGDRIALSGAPSGGKSPRLHFEIRKGKTAANPIFYLP
jgi:lipoprotein NlpD